MFRLFMLLMLSAAVPARAQSPVTSAMLLRGAGFDDAVYGLSTADGIVQTVLLDATDPWRHGENTFYIRIFSGKFVDAGGAPTGQQTLTYAEWTTRLSLLPAGRREQPGHRLRDLVVAGQINRGGTGFRANLAGIGMKLRLPGGMLATTSVYYRRAPGESPGAKWRTSWFGARGVGEARVSFEGSFDVVTGTATGTDVSAMPALLVDAGPVFAIPAGIIQIGAEWFVHRTRGAHLSAPQLAVRWMF
jgi:hypothetical protein